MLVQYQSDYLYDSVILDHSRQDNINQKTFFFKLVFKMEKQNLYAMLECNQTLFWRDTDIFYIKNVTKCIPKIQCFPFIGNDILFEEQHL
jgi:hypothetical protein